MSDNNSASRPRARRRIVIGSIAVILLIPTAVIAAGGAFTDDDTSVFEANIEWLAASGVTKGCNPPTNDQFCPEDNVTRGQMAAFMQRFAQYLDAEDGTPAEADNAATLDGADPVAYTTQIDGAACYFGECPDPSGPGAVVDAIELEVDVPADGVMSISYGFSGSISSPSNDLFQTWVTVDGTTNSGCNGWFFAPTGAVDGSYAVAGLDGSITLASTGSSTTVEISEGTHTIRVCGLSLDTLNVDGASLSTVWSASGSGVPLAFAEFSQDQLGDLRRVMGEDVRAID